MRLSEWGRRVTLLVVPPADYPLLRMRFSLGSIALLGGLWSLATLWAGISVGRHVDYFGTKVDNAAMRTRVGLLSSEMEALRGEVGRARETDRRLRELLQLPDARAIVERAPLQAPGPVLASPVSSGAGGPTAADLGLLRAVLRQAQADPETVRRRVAETRAESDRALASLEELSRMIDRERARLRATPRGWPATGWISSTFGYRLSPMSRDDVGGAEHHGGLDIANRLGTPVRATADGVVEQARWRGGYGRLVLLRHSHGYRTLFGHNSRVLVREGQQVVRGQVIALMGSTGRSTGSHLHYEVWRDGRPTNPARFLKER